MTYTRDLTNKAAIAAIQYDKEGEYWLNKFSGELVKTSFPYDRRKSLPGRQEKDSVTFALSKPCASKLMELCKGLAHRLYIILAAGLVALLHRYTGEKDIIIGSPIVQQEKEENFINTVLALRNRWAGNITFKELLLDHVRQTIAEASEHQNYPIETLLLRLNMPFNREDFPLFDTMILLENIHDKKYVDHTNPQMIFSFLQTGNEIQGKVEYNPELYYRENVQRIAGHFKCLLEEVVFNLNIPLVEISVISGEEKKQLLVDFNDTGLSYPPDKTIHELFAEQVEKTPDNIALVGRKAGDAVRCALTYRTLDEISNRLALLLRKKGVDSDTIVGIMVERSPAMIPGILAILKAGGAYLPINPKNPPVRTKYMLADSGAHILVTADTEFNVRRSTFNSVRSLTSPHHLAYLIYTSGSTGNPKGVAVSHGNFCPLLYWGKASLAFSPDDRAVQNLSYFFDWSVWEIFLTLLSGARLYMVEEEVLLNPGEYMDFINKNGITILHITPSHLQSLIALEQSFPSLKYLCIGAEKLTYDIVKRSYGLIREDCRVFNMYGPTEATIIASVLEIDKTGEEWYTKLLSVPIGKPVGRTTLLVLDRNLKLCPVNVRGELYIGGDGLSRGYLNNPELTAEKFCLRRPRGAGGLLKIYKTGDLVRWLTDGSLEFFGRVDQQVKIRGFRIEPGEIENRLLGHDGIKAAAVIIKERESGDKYLCAYIVSDREVSAPALKEKLSRQFADYMVPAYFVRVDRIPLTPNGKIDAGALPEPQLDRGVEYTAPANEIEEKLAAAWSEILAIEKSMIGTNANFFDLGGHSLKATIFIARIHKTLGVKIPLAEIFTSPTIRELAQYIKKLKTERFSAVPIAEKKQYYKLSSAQRRLYVLQQVELESTAYNLPQAMIVKGELDRRKIAGIFNESIGRHESLRTSFHMVEKEPVQRLHEKNWELQITEHRQIAHFLRPFDLAKAPLLRVGLIKLQESDHILLVDMHHIITDGTSMELFIRECMALYAGEGLPALRFQYKDYAEWQNSKEQREVVGQQEKYWLRQFAGEIPVLDLPIDFARPTVWDFAGDTIAFELSAGQTGELNRLAAAQGVTLYMLLLAVTSVLLAKSSNREDIVIGTPTAARRHVALERIIGMFVNTLPMRNFPKSEKTFQQFLKEVKNNTLQAFENQEYPFEDLVEKVLVEREPSRNPLFAVSLALQNVEMQTKEIPQPGAAGLHIEPYEIENKTAKFDIGLVAVEARGQLYFTLEYCTKLFKADTIKRFIAYWEKIVSAVVKEPGIKIGQIEILSEEERNRLLFDFNDTGTGYPQDSTIHELVKEQAGRTPDRVVLAKAPFGQSVNAFGEVHLSYKELDDRAARLACRLMEKGVLADTIVAIMMERSIEMIAGILAILKAGGAYLPIDPDYPKERIDYMLRDSNARILLKNNTIESTNTPLLGGVAEGRGGFLGDLQPATSLAYLLYTSGSTGRPKGVMVTHRNVVRLVINPTYIEFKPAGRLLLTGSMMFDITTFEIWGPLLNGLTLYLADQNDILAGKKLKDILIGNRIDILHLVPQVFNQLASRDIGMFGVLDYLLVGGDLVNAEYINKVRKEPGRVKVLHMYGPTENTTFSTFYPVEQEYEIAIPIGKPINNSTVYITDKYGNLEPLGVVGELCVGGAGVARGYLNNPGLTAERFEDEKKIKSFLGGPGAPRRGEPICGGSAVRCSDHLFPPAPVTCTCHLCAKEPPARRSLYKTGDLVKWLPGGNLEFLGRSDSQVKIRGIRIETEEIENRLLKHDDIKEAVVAAGTREEDKYLCAYIVLEPGKELSSSQLREFLEEKLPAVMIPAYFVRLEKMPLTPNGKIDRRSLPQPGFKKEEAHTAPRDEIERKLASLWGELLGIEKDIISIDANFFRLGGHSLAATALAYRIQQEFAVTVPLVELFKKTTVRLQGSYIGAAKGGLFSLRDHRLVSIKQASEKANHLFFFHDGTGGVEGYIELCNGLKTGFNCWGLRMAAASDENGGPAPRNCTIEELARTYIDKIKKVQPAGQGPYYIAGWSLGGTIAFETALQLEEAGEEIAFLGLIDAPGPGREPIPPFGLESEIDWVWEYLPDEAIKEKIKKAADIDEMWSIIIDHLEENQAGAGIVKRLIPDDLARLLPNYHGLGAGELINHLDIERTLTRARALYSPTGRIRSAVRYFKAGRSPQIFQDSWKAYCRKPIQTYEIPGSHFSILQGPAVARLVELFDALLPPAARGKIKKH